MLRTGQDASESGLFTPSDGPTLSQRDRFIEAIACYAKNSYAYFNLGITVTDSETVTLKDGRKLSKRDCYIEAIACDTKNSKAYITVASHDHWIPFLRWMQWPYYCRLERTVKGHCHRNLFPGWMQWPYEC